jgi:hypothetical protein
MLPLPAVTYLSTTTLLMYHDDIYLPLMISPSYIADLYLLGAAAGWTLTVWDTRGLRL